METEKRGNQNGECADYSHGLARLCCTYLLRFLDAVWALFVYGTFSFENKNTLTLPFYSTDKTTSRTDRLPMFP